jgi:hypothetical protein
LQKAPFWLASLVCSKAMVRLRAMACSRGRVQVVAPSMVH